MRKIYKALLFCFFVSSAFNVFGQEESFPCKEANPDLKNLFNGKTLESLYVHDCYGPGLNKLSSSYLKESGTPPAIIKDPDGMEPPDDADYVAWTCKYSMGNIGDNNPATAWVEGVKGYGIGEVLIVPCIDLNKPVIIWAGYGKSASVYLANSRPKEVRLVIIQAELDGFTQYGNVYKNLRMVSQKMVALKDLNGYQPIDLPYYKTGTYEKDAQQWEYTYFLGLEILDVYKGNKWDDTCISEIRNE